MLSDLMGERWNLEIPASSFSALDAAEGSVKGLGIEVDTRGRRLRRRRRQRKKVMMRRRTAARMMLAERILAHLFIFGSVCVY